MEHKHKHQFYTLLRVALTGKKDGPDVVKIIKILGVEESFNRINYLLDKVDALEEGIKKEYVDIVKDQERIVCGEQTTN